MMKEKLEYYLVSKGFFALSSKLSEVKVLVKFENNLANVLQIIDYTDNLYLDKEQYEEVKNSLKHMFCEKGISETHILSLILTESQEKYRILSEGDAFCWWVDKQNENLIINEEKQPDFYGMKGLIEDFLEKYQIDPSQFTNPGLEESENTDQKTNWFDVFKKLPFVSISIVVINLVMCICCIVNPVLFYGKGCVGLSYILQGEWYRIFTAMFLHGSLDHFFSNMLLLYFLGDMLENRIGCFRFVFLYLLTGVIGNIVSCLHEYLANISYISFGASGAVFGLIGMLFYLVMHREKDIRVSMPAMFFMVIYCIYSSFAEIQVNVAAHLGGLLSGMLLMFVFYPRRKSHEG